MVSVQEMRVGQTRIGLEDAIRIKSAEFWLELGQPVEAIRELRRLSQRGRRHPWALEVLRRTSVAAQGHHFACTHAEEMN